MNGNPNDPKTQHPIPGSYSRPSFNPMTQSFVPANGGISMQSASGPYGTSSPLHGSPQMMHQSVNFGGYQPSIPPPGGYAPPPLPLGSYGMARQGSNNSIAGYHHAQQAHMGTMTPGLAHQSHLPPQSHIPLKPQNHMPVKPAVPQGPIGRNFTHLPTYGNPATLPQKPAI